MDEMMCARSLFHAFFDDNDGWHVTAVDLLSWRRLLCPSTDVNKRVHCVRAGQFTTAPPHTMNDCKLGRWGARLSVQRVMIINKLLTHGPLRSALSAAVYAVDNGETKTRTTINLDNRLCDYRLTSVTITLWTNCKIKKVKILSRDC